VGGGDRTVTNEERQRAIAFMPSDYMPGDSPDYMPVYAEYYRSFKRLDDATAGLVIKRSMDYAADYAASYDKSLEPDFDGINERGEMVLDLICASIRRAYDAHRLTSFLRSPAYKELKRS